MPPIAWQRAILAITIVAGAALVTDISILAGRVLTRPEIEAYLEANGAAVAALLSGAFALFAGFAALAVFFASRGRLLFASGFAALSLYANGGYIVSTVQGGMLDGYRYHVLVPALCGVLVVSTIAALFLAGFSRVRPRTAA
ncbi:MAG: hypothetical protein QNK03_28120 [Myxococcota bacterium]|nr:hypothetical protein [Myxococcota bacterium]